MIESDAQQEIRMLQPIRTVQPMQTDQEKRSREKLRTVSPPGCGSSQQQETCSQTNEAFQNSGCPVEGAKSLGPVSLHVINRRKNQSDKRKRGINAERNGPQRFGSFH